jgi:Domain of unknown function (DUF4129)
VPLPLDLPEPTHDPDQARQLADEILSRPEYQWTDDRPLIERINDWIGDQLARLGSALAFGGLPVWVGYLILGALLGGLAYLIWRTRDSWLRAAGPGRRGGRGRVVVSADEDLVDWPAEVARAEAEGRWRDALRARYRVLVGDLAARGVLGDLVGRTTGELTAEVRAVAPAAGPAFAAATDLFEAVWYGGAPVGPGDRDRFVPLADEARRRAEPVGAR